MIVKSGAFLCPPGVFKGPKERASVLHEGKGAQMMNKKGAFLRPPGVPKKPQERASALHSGKD